jgi:hypothetical protein
MLNFCDIFHEHKDSVFLIAEIAFKVLHPAQAPPAFGKYNYFT